MSEIVEIVKTEKGTAKVFKIFVKNVNISQNSDFDPNVEHVKDPTLEAILKYKKHRSILVIRTKCNRNGVFSFSKVNLGQIETGTGLLKLNKVSQYSE